MGQTKDTFTLGMLSAAVNRRQLMRAGASSKAFEQSGITVCVQKDDISLLEPGEALRWH